MIKKGQTYINTIKESVKRNNLDCDTYKNILNTYFNEWLFVNINVANITATEKKYIVNILKEFSNNQNTSCEI